MSRLAYSTTQQYHNPYPVKKPHVCRGQSVLFSALVILLMAYVLLALRVVPVFCMCVFRKLGIRGGTPLLVLKRARYIKKISCYLLGIVVNSAVISEMFTIFHFPGDKKVLFADKILKFTGSGKMKRRILLITDFAIYVVDPETAVLKRRIALAAVEKLCLSELSDNFFAIIIPTEYDMLMASTRKTEIVTVLVEALKSTSDYELEVEFSNR